VAHPDEPCDAIQVVGDTDTIAAMPGALAVARCIASALSPWPGGWS
jgi:ADP-ribosylglycohydrolase